LQSQKEGAWPDGRRQIQTDGLLGLRHRQAVANSNTLLAFGIEGDFARVLADSNYTAYYELGCDISGRPCLAHLS